MYRTSFQDVSEAKKLAKQKSVLFFETPCICYQNKSLSEVFPAIKGTNASEKLKNWYHVTPSHFSILVYNLLIKSKREYFWLQLQSLKLYNGVHAVRSLYFLKISMLLVKIQNVTPSHFQNCNFVSFS